MSLKSINKNINLIMYVINAILRGKSIVQYLRTPCFCFRNGTGEHSEGVGFLVQKQVNKYLTLALFMKYSLCTKMFSSIVAVLNPPMLSEQTYVIS